MLLSIQRKQATAEMDMNLLVAMRLRETPVPIPNTTVKTFTADGTMRATAWESRWLPDIFINMIFISDEKLLLKVTASDD